MCSILYKLEILRRHQNYESDFLLPAAVDCQDCLWVDMSSKPEKVN